VPRVAGLLVLAAGLAAACAAPPAPPPPPPPVAPARPPPRDDLYVVVPDPAGEVGAVTVTHGGAEQRLDRPYAAARIREPGRLEAGLVTEQEVREVFGEARAAQPPRPVSFTLYFLEGRDELTLESTRLLDAILAELARRPAPEISVVGHTDRVGTVAFNDALSRQRAERVRVELLRLGIAPERIQVSGRGEREPLVPTEDEVAEPRNRRVEISIR
jgi:outer membrane protein OmpA-like peptidoglycan-associated protein